MRSFISILFCLSLCACVYNTSGPPSFTGGSAVRYGELFFVSNICGADENYGPTDALEAEESRLEVEEVPGSDLYNIRVFYGRGVFRFLNVAIRNDGTFDGWVTYPGGTSSRVLGFILIHGKLEATAKADLEIYSFKDDATEYSSASPDCKYTLRFEEADY